AVTARLRELQSALGLSGDITLELVTRQPDVVSIGANDATPPAWPEVEAVGAEAAADCRAMRAREGETLAPGRRRRTAPLEAAAAAIERRAPERLARERDRLRGAVAELLDGRPADEGRLAQEIAFQADRLDITEELVRFRAHVAAVREALAAPRP